MMELFDTHCHVDDPRFDEDRAETHQRMLEAGVTRYAVIGTDLEASRHVVDYVQDRPGGYAAVGFHPSDVGKYRGEEDLSALAALAKNPKVRAIGEIGLDYYWKENPPKEAQIAACADQIELAWTLGLPCAFHVRDAYGDMLELLKKHRDHLLPGIMHCFSGSWEVAEICLGMGMYISLAGPLTFQNARGLPQVAARLPRERILIETDSPYLAPVPMRGKRNEPAFVRHTCARLAEIRGESLEDTASFTTDNALRVYMI